MRILYVQHSQKLCGLSAPSGSALSVLWTTPAQYRRLEAQLLGSRAAMQGPGAENFGNCFGRSSGA